MAGVLEVGGIMAVSARGLPSVDFDKALTMFFGFMIPVSAYVIFFLLSGGVDRGSRVCARLFFLFLPAAIVHVKGVSFTYKVKSIALEP